MQPNGSDKNKNKDTLKADNELVRRLAEEKYKYGFTTDVHTDIIDRGLTEDTVRLISEKKGEPEWLLDFRLKAYRHWLTMDMPTWAHLRIPEIDYQSISYYADPTAQKKNGPKSMDEVDPELIKTFNKLGIPLEEQMALSGMAVHGRGRRDGLRVRQDHLQGDAPGERHHLLLHQRGGARASGPGAEVPG